VDFYLIGEGTAICTCAITAWTLSSIGLEGGSLGSGRGMSVGMGAGRGKGPLSIAP